jgi:hypothetical protein
MGYGLLTPLLGSATITLPLFVRSIRLYSSEVKLNLTFNHLSEDVVDVGAIGCRDLMKCKFVLLSELQTPFLLNFPIVLEI